MLDNKILRDDPEEVARKLKPRGFVLDVARLKSLESKRKKLQTETQDLQNERNTRSKAIGLAKAKQQPIEPLLAEVAQLGDKLTAHENALNVLQSEIQEFYSFIPNIPDSTVPLGAGEEQNVEVRRWGNPPHFNFKIKDHIELTEKSKEKNTSSSIDFESSIKLSGSRFVVIFGALARLHRALGQLMLDLHTKEHGYQEVYVPYLVKESCLYGTGQLPKMKEDLFKIENHDLQLIPTSEVAVTNLHREEILEETILPLKYVCYSPCFRSEAGSYGKDLKGMIRLHQFDKVEIVQFVKPEHSYSTLEEMVTHAEKVLQKLNLAYRVVALCTGDLGFYSAKTYDLEVWLPGQNKYREISSCSNTESFQARRMQARFRSEETKKPEFLHTLNGSGLAVGRTLVAVIENYQDEEGNITVPDVLVPYMGGMKKIILN